LEIKYTNYEYGYDFHVSNVIKKAAGSSSFKSSVFILSFGIKSHNMWRRPLAYFLFALGLLTVTFFRHYSGEIIPYPIVFWLAGLAMFWGGFFFLRNTPTNADIKAEKQLTEMINDLKANGEKIIVDLVKCEMKGNTYTEETIKYGNKNDFLTLGIEREIEAWNALGGDSLRNTENVDVAQTVIIYSRPNSKTGIIETFISRVIYKDEITLSFYLERQKQTTLYVDKNDRKKYYFDLDFLDS